MHVRLATWGKQTWMIASMDNKARWILRQNTRSLKITFNC